MDGWETGPGYGTAWFTGCDVARGKLSSLPVALDTYFLGFKGPREFFTPTNGIIELGASEVVSQRFLSREFLPLKILGGHILIVNPIISEYFSIRAETVVGEFHGQLGGFWDF